MTKLVATAIACCIIFDYTGKLIHWLNICSFFRCSSHAKKEEQQRAGRPGLVTVTKPRFYNAILAVVVVTFTLTLTGSFQPAKKLYQASCSIVSTICLHPSVWTWTQWMRPAFDVSSQCTFLSQYTGKLR